MDSTLDVTGATTLNFTLDVSGNTTLKSDLTVKGTTILEESLTVQGTTTLQSGLNVNNGNISLSGGTFGVTNGTANFQITDYDIQIISPLNPPGSTSVVTKDYVDNYVVNYVVNYVDVAIPIGGIIMWSNATIPTNWQLCDGSPIPGGNPYANTPDLRDRFVYGWGSNSASLKGIGPQPDGQSLVTLNIDQIPAHTHQSYVNFSETEVAGSEGGSNVAGATPVTASTDTTSIGSNGQHNNMPPYYVLAFIMRIA